MIICYLRSSSEGTYRHCGLKFFIDYVLGKKSPTGSAALKGCAVHKYLEIIALKKLSEKNGQTVIQDDVLGEIDLNKIDKDKLLEECIGAFAEECWSKTDWQDCRKWVNNALTMNKGEYNPENLNIIAVEQKFDIEFTKPWAHYKYKVGEEIIEGNFSVKGVSDLAIEIDKDHLCIRDWKTGRRSDWATGKTKELDDLYKDFQLLLYGYAMKQIFPQYKYISLCLVFLKDGGPFEIMFGPDEYKYIEKKIQSTYETIKKDMKPRRNLSYRCKWCHWSVAKNKSGTTMCDWIHEKVQKLGADEVFKRHGDITKIQKYQEGGGKTAKE